MLLKGLIKVLGEEFGTAAVVEEAIDQHNNNTEKVQVLAEDSMMYHITLRSARITAASVIFGWSFKQSKEWVETHFDDNGPHLINVVARP